MDDREHHIPVIYVAYFGNWIHLLRKMETDNFWRRIISIWEFGDSTI